MKPESLRSQVLSLIEQIEALEANINKSNFISDANKEDCLDEVNSMIVSLDSIEDSLDNERELDILAREL